MQVDTITSRGAKLEVHYEGGEFKVDMRGRDGRTDVITADSLAALKKKVAARQRIAAAKLDIPFLVYRDDKVDHPSSYGRSHRVGGWLHGHVVGLNASTDNPMVRFDGKGVTDNETAVHQWNRYDHLSGGGGVGSGDDSAVFGDLSDHLQRQYVDLITARKAASQAVREFIKQHGVDPHTIAREAIAGVTNVNEEGDIE